MQCPVCGQKENIKPIRELRTTKVTGSCLYKDIEVMECENCGHGFNRLYADAKLKDFYRYEYGKTRYSEPVSSEIGLNQEIGSLILSQANPELQQAWLQAILDIHDEHYSDFPESDIISLNHFLEHCWEPENVLKMASMRLSEAGLLHISVPDYSRYKQTVNDDIPYLFLIKEHIQHFTLTSLNFLCSQYGFYQKESTTGEIGLFKDRLKMPVLDAYFSKINPNGLYCYGAGRELMYLLESDVRLNTVKISGIIDDVPEKRGLKINGIEVFSSSIVPHLSEKAKIYISAVYYRPEIEENLKKLGYRGKIT